MHTTRAAVVICMIFQCHCFFALPSAEKCLTSWDICVRCASFMKQGLQGGRFRPENPKFCLRHRGARWASGEKNVYKCLYNAYNTLRPEAAFQPVRPSFRQVEKMKNVFAIFVVGAGGFVGSVLRYLLSQTAQRFSMTFPHGTLWANFLGCLLLGIVVSVATETQSISPSTRLFLATGLCGGFTTMSTFTYETVRFLQDSEYLYAAGYLAATVTGCIFLFGLGLFGTRLLLKG